jgi:hypothetical protein
VTLKLSAYEDWNVAFLPTDRRTADILKLPLHPGADNPEIVRHALEFISAARDQYGAAYDEAERKQQLGGLQERIDEIAGKVKGLAVHVLARYAED